MGIQTAPTYDPTAPAPPSPIVSALAHGLLAGQTEAVATCEHAIAGLRHQPFALAGVIKGLFELAFLLDTAHGRAELADEVLALVHRTLGLLAEHVGNADGRGAVAALALKATKTIDLPEPRAQSAHVKVGVGLRRKISKPAKGSP